MKILTITGIRPDFIRMKEVFNKLDKNFDHIMIHTGQHYDDELSKIFFDELEIREPDYVLDTGINSKNHYEQLAYLSKEVIYLIKRKKLNPDLIILLGDSNSVLVSVPLFKEGYKIAHIEGGMRSYDRRMLEEVNRVVCDYVSDYVFVYTPLYKERLMQENKDPESIFVVGNTIVEVVKQYMPRGKKKGGYLVADIHRYENLVSPRQYRHILEYVNGVGKRMNLPVKLAKFRRAFKLIEDYDLLKWLKNIEVSGPNGFVEFLKLQYHAEGVISDSGTSQEECPLLRVPVAVPRDFTERPESLEFGNSILVGEGPPIEQMIKRTVHFFENYYIDESKVRWLGDGNTSSKIVQILSEHLNEGRK